MPVYVFIILYIMAGLFSAVALLTKFEENIKYPCSVVLLTFLFWPLAILVYFGDIIYVLSKMLFSEFLSMLRKDKK